MSCSFWLIVRAKPLHYAHTNSSPKLNFRFFIQFAKIMQYILYILQYMLYILPIRSLIMKNIRLITARIERDMNQQDLADAVGVTRQTIGLIESGNYNPTLKLCLAICKTLNKTLDELFWEELP